MQVLGSISATVRDPAIADAVVDQQARTVTIVGKALGATVVTVRDERGLTRDVPVRVADPAGSVADTAYVRMTGRPASPAFLREQALAAALASVRTRPGANVTATTDTINVAAPLRVDDIATVDVPVIVSGDGYFTVQGTTHVRVENFAQPAIHPQSLLVSDFPETLKENGILFTADLTREAVRTLPLLPLQSGLRNPTGASSSRCRIPRVSPRSCNSSPASRGPKATRWRSDTSPRNASSCASRKTKARS